MTPGGAGPDESGGPAVVDGAGRRPHEAEFAFEYGTAVRARVVAESVAREVGAIDDERSRARVDRDGERVTVAVEAADLTALRAAGNTWCSLVEVAETVAAIPDRNG